jgi:hypothetical protein
MAHFGHRRPDHVWVDHLHKIVFQRALSQGHADEFLAPSRNSRQQVSSLTHRQGPLALVDGV